VTFTERNARTTCIEMKCGQRQKVRQARRGSYRLDKETTNKHPNRNRRIINLI
jgi:hypothetical protein